MSTRPGVLNTVRDVYSYSSSSTEWNFDGSFTPNFFGTARRKFRN